MEVFEETTPSICAVVPIVTLEPVAQKIFLARAPPARVWIGGLSPALEPKQSSLTIFLPFATSRDPAMEKIQVSVALGHDCQRLPSQHLGKDESLQSGNGDIS